MTQQVFGSNPRWYVPIEDRALLWDLERLLEEAFQGPRYMPEEAHVFEVFVTPAHTISGPLNPASLDWLVCRYLDEHKVVNEFFLGIRTNEMGRPSSFILPASTPEAALGRARVLRSEEDYSVILNIRNLVAQARSLLSEEHDASVHYLTAASHPYSTLDFYSEEAEQFSKFLRGYREGITVHVGTNQESVRTIIPMTAQTLFGVRSTLARRVGIDPKSSLSRLLKLTHAVIEANADPEKGHELASLAEQLVEQLVARGRAAIADQHLVAGLNEDFTSLRAQRPDHMFEQALRVGDRLHLAEVGAPDLTSETLVTMMSIHARESALI